MARNVIDPTNLIWVVLLTTGWLTYRIFTLYDLRTVLQQPADGSLSFWVAVDIVVAMPVSWLPLVAGYNRFARRGRPSFWGTYAGYFITNVWFYALGTLALLAASVAQAPKEFATAIARSQRAGRRCSFCLWTRRTMPGRTCTRRLCRSRTCFLGFLSVG